MLEFQILDGSRMWVRPEDVISVREQLNKPAYIIVRTHVPQRPVEQYDLLTNVDELIRKLGNVSPEKRRDKWTT